MTSQTRTIVVILEVTNISEMLPGLSWLKIYPQGERTKSMLSKISIHYRKCFTKYCTDSIELFTNIFLKTSMMFNILFTCSKL